MLGVLGQQRFSLLPDDERSNAVRAFSARLFIGKWREHKEAAAFLDEQMRAHGEGVDTLVRALLCYRDALRDDDAESNGQMRIVRR